MSLPVRLGAGRPSQSGLRPASSPRGGAKTQTLPQPPLPPPLGEVARRSRDREGKRSLARCGGDGNFWTRAVPAVWPKDLTWMLLPRSLQKRRAIMDK